MRRAFATLLSTAAIATLIVAAGSGTPHDFAQAATPEVTIHQKTELPTPVLVRPVVEPIQVAQADETLTPTPDPLFTGDETTPTVVEDATLKVTGETSVPQGEIVELRAEGTAKDIQWIVRPEPSKLRFYEGGTILVFNPNATAYEVFTVGALGDDSVVTITPVKIVGPPAPPPKPTGLEAKIITWFQAVEVQDPSVDVVKLADSFKKIKQLIKDEVLTEPGAIMAATGASNRAALGDHLEPWKVAFLQPLAEELTALAEAGQLETAADHARIWEEIEMSLRKLGGPSN